jgi:alkanesulfonate monooxygenase SsuD/methylene tetrahydromethanopterin reductase-like flavin-dependent oxidoreductase (luciferase family)
VDAGILLPTREMTITGRTDARALLDYARRVEALGFHSLWVSDSLTARARVEPLTVLAAVAGVTERIRLGTAALTGAIRQPLLAAHAIATLDQLAGGRLTLGLGAGFPYAGSEAEFAAAGVPFRERVGRLVDTVRAWRAVWSASGASAPQTYHGRYFTLDGIEQLPPPAQPHGPKLWLAGGDMPGVLRRVGRYFDGWLPYLPSADAYAAGLAQIAAAAEEAGRDPRAILPALYVTVNVQPDRQAALAELEDYVLRYYGLPLQMMQGLQAFFAGDVGECVEWLAGYARAGARHVVLRVGSFRPEPHLERLAVTLLPGLEAA